MKLWQDRGKEEQEVDRKKSKVWPAERNPDQEHNGPKGQVRGGRVGDVEVVIDYACGNDACEPDSDVARELDDVVKHVIELVDHKVGGGVVASKAGRVGGCLQSSP